jgi:molybdopterin molybdotransferase
MGQEKNNPMIPVPEAIRIVIRETAKSLLSNGGKQNPTLTLPLTSSTPWSDLLHWVLEKDVLMEEPGYPPYNASIMDGFAIRTADFNVDDAIKAAATTDGWTHVVVDKIYAGDDGEAANSANTDQGESTTMPSSSSDMMLPSAFYITTGAVVPDTYNCVVPIEQCQVSHDRKRVRIDPSADLDDLTWIRPVGCDIPALSVVLPRGHTIDPVAVGLLKQSGTTSIEVKRRVKVGVLSTGNELLDNDGENNSPLTQKQIVGKIPDVNRPVLLSLLTTYGECCEPVDLGMCRDDNIDAMALTVRAALGECDVIITTGGVSMGETDIVQKVLVEYCGGTLHFGRMHMKPGKPTTFVTVPKGDDGGTTLVFAMPGNPVSAIVCTQLLVKPCLDLYFHGIKSRVLNDTGMKHIDQIVEETLVHPEILGRLAQDIKLDPKRPEYHRVIVERQPDGTYEVFTTGVQRSSRLMSLRDAEALVVLPHVDGGKTKALKGEIFPVLLLDGSRHYGVEPVRIRDSIHMNEAKKKATVGMKVSVVEVLPSTMLHLSRLEATCEAIQSALSGSKSGNANVVSKKTFTGSINELYSVVAKEESSDVDFIVVSCVTFAGSFSYHLDVSIALRKQLSKLANSLALQARQGAASQDPKAALFEVIVGYVPEQGGAMLICLPDIGVQGALSNVRGLLKHGLNLARGKPQNDHHNHRHHQHTAKD